MTDLSDLRMKAEAAKGHVVTLSTDAPRSLIDRLEAAEAACDRLKGTLDYIRVQAKTRASGDALTLSVIERNASAALDEGWQATVRAALSISAGTKPDNASVNEPSRHPDTARAEAAEAARDRLKAALGDAATSLREASRGLRLANMPASSKAAFADADRAIAALNGSAST